MNEHTLEEDWQHFLSYSGYWKEDDATKDKLKQAFIAAWSLTPEALQTRLTATEAVVTAARELMEMSVPLCTTRLCRNHGDIILHVRDCEYTDKKKVYYAVLARLQEMTE